MDLQFTNKFESLIGLPFEILPSQRQINVEHVNSMIQHGISRITNGLPPIFNPISVALLTINGKEIFYVVDGQHRLETYKYLHYNNYRCTVFIFFNRVNSLEEADNIFKLLNTINPLPNIYLCGTVTPLDKEIEKYLTTVPGFSATSKIRPHVNITEFLNMFNVSHHKKHIHSLEIFKLFLNHFSETIKNLIQDPKMYKSWKLTDNIMAHFNLWNLYIAADKSFVWLK